MVWVAQSSCHDMVWVAQSSCHDMVWVAQSSCHDMVWVHVVRHSSRNSNSVAYPCVSSMTQKCISFVLSHKCMDMRSAAVRFGSWPVSFKSWLCAIQVSKMMMDALRHLRDVTARGTPWHLDAIVAPRCPVITLEAAPHPSQARSCSCNWGPSNSSFRIPLFKIPYRE